MLKNYYAYAMISSLLTYCEIYPSLKGNTVEFNFNIPYFNNVTNVLHIGICENVSLNYRNTG